MIYLTVNLEDCKSPNIDLKENQLYFRYDHLATHKVLFFSSKSFAPVKRSILLNISSYFSMKAYVVGTQ